MRAFAFYGKIALAIVAENEVSSHFVGQGSPLNLVSRRWFLAHFNN
jgi:hypothetical protein